MPESPSQNGKTEARLLFLHAQTSLHPGSGTALGVVDLPVQRERHTRWPIIPGSALKGILRDRCREKAKGNHADEKDETGKLKRTRRRVTNEDDESLISAFGPGKVMEEDSSFAGAISVTDARILAFPVRSLKGVFAWVTCIAVLDRLNRDLKIAQLPALPGVIPQPSKSSQGDQAACIKGSPLLVDGSQLVLEEFDFKDIGGAEKMAEWIAMNAVTDATTQARIRTHFVVLHDDDFSHFVQHATEVAARIALDYERKTVRSGALFYQEFLPPETLFYALVIATASRFDKHPQTAEQTMAYLAEQLPSETVLQVGGDETTGKGLCLVQLSDGKKKHHG